MDVSKHFSLQAGAQLEPLCKPLEKLGITYFNYINIQHDNHDRALLTNRPDWIEHFYQCEFYRDAGAINVEHLLPKGYFLWDELDQKDTIYKHSRQHFNIDHGITFVVKKENNTQLYIFAAENHCEHMNHFYIHHLDLLKRFILFFHDKGAPLINEAESNKIILPEKQCITSSHESHIRLGPKERETFLSETEINRYHLIHNNTTIYLTKKQAQCAALISTGATSKVCAKQMAISPRTVEDYLEAIKTKIANALGNRLSKTDLIALLKKNDIHIALPSCLYT